MRFFFVLDYRGKYRYISSEPFSEIQVKFSHWKKIWESAKKKLMLLPRRILRQEQAFRNALNLKEGKISIFHSGRLDEKKIKTKFRFFLRKQKTKHIFFLVGETVLLPVSGLMAILPGPNVFFGVLALLMLTHWQAFRGINRILKKKYEFIPSLLISKWEETLEFKREGDFLHILEKIEKEYNMPNIHKVLWK
jgi:hypothetical protein